MKDTDLAATIVGGLAAAATAASPVLNAVQPGTSLHPQDYAQLGAAIFMALLGFFTNKKPTV